MQSKTEMKKIVDEDLSVSRKELASDEAINLFKSMKEYLKIDLIEDIEDGLSAYSQGEFTDLCRGPHCTINRKIR